MRPDTALYTLYLRALVQQDKWEAAETLFQRMLAGTDAARPNALTVNYLLQFQVSVCKCIYCMYMLYVYMYVCILYM